MLSTTRAKAPDGTPDTRRTAGAGEVVDFFPQTSPNVLDFAGTPASWTATAGTPTSAIAVPVFTWAAPEPAGDVTITATPSGSSQSISTTIKILAPNAISTSKDSEDSYPAGTEGAGMMLSATFQPLSVNFDNVQELEDPGPSTNVSGYFNKLRQAGLDLSHHPNPNWVGLAGNSFKDHAFWHGPLPIATPPSWEPGHFEWAIPSRYRALRPGFGVGGPGVLFTTARQTFDMLGSDGTMAISKQGATVRRSPGSVRGG
jgi:hypothetical protein